MTGRIDSETIELSGSIGGSAIGRGIGKGGSAIRVGADGSGSITTWGTLRNKFRVSALEQQNGWKRELKSASRNTRAEVAMAAMQAI